MQKQSSKQKLKKNPQTKCRSNCAAHKFKFKPKNEGLYHQSVGVSYCPLYLEKNLKHESILPTINADGKKYYPLFCIDFDKDHYKQYEQKYQEEHEKKVKDYVQQKKELYEPKPGRKTRWCAVCKTQYDDYLEHVKNQQHSMNAKSNHYIKEIQKIASMFSGLHRHDNTILQQQTSEETILNKGENISSTIEPEQFESDCMIVDQEKDIKMIKNQSYQQTQELIRPMSNQNQQINQQINIGYQQSQQNLKMDQQQHQLIDIKLQQIPYNNNNNYYIQNAPAQQQQRFNIIPQPQQQFNNTYTDNLQFSNQLKTSGQLKINNNNNKKRQFNQMMEGGQQYLDPSQNNLQNQYFYNENVNLTSNNQQNNQQCRKRVKKVIDLTGGDVNQNININTSTNNNNTTGTTTIYQQQQPYYGNQLPQQQYLQIQNIQNNDFNERWQSYDQFQFDNVAMNIVNYDQQQQIIQNKNNNIMINGNNNMCLQQQVQYIANNY